MKIDVSIESARGIYEFVKDHNDFMGKFQQQIIPVIELPRFVREKLPTATCLCMEEKNADEGCGICLLVHSSHSKSSQRVLERIYMKKEKVGLLHVDSFVETLGINFSSNVKSESLQFIYEHALSISKILSIDPPAIMIVKQEEIPGLHAARIQSKNLQTGAIGNKIKLVCQDPIYMLESLAHELRHCWQEQYQKELLLDYKSFYDTSENYLSQPAEIDAEAFAGYYLERIGCKITRQFTKEHSDQERFYELVGERKKEISEEYNKKAPVEAQSNVNKNNTEEHKKEVRIRIQSNRYKKIQELKSQGFSIGQIAKKLGISYQTVSKEWQ